MISINLDLFSPPILPKPREFEISILRSPTLNIDPTIDLAKYVKAIQILRPPKPVLIPPIAEFFDFNNISEYELNFSFSQSPIYMEVRNFMVSISRIFNNRYIPFTLFRRNIKCSVNYLMKVWNFLTECGLINYKVEKLTKPSSSISILNKWPTLYYTLNEQILTSEDYNKKLHPNPIPNNISKPSYPLLWSSFNNNKSQVNNATTIGDFTFDESIKILDFIEKNPEAKISSLPFNFNKTDEQIANNILEMPFTHSNLDKQVHSTFQEFHNPKELLILSALEKDLNLKLIYNSIENLGKENTLKLFYNKKIINIYNSEQATSLLTLKKIKENSLKLKELHKKRILNILSTIIDFTKKNIELKQSMISQQIQERDYTNSESEPLNEEKNYDDTD